MTGAGWVAGALCGVLGLIVLASLVAVAVIAMRSKPPQDGE